jgi:catechol 2,3-dioxygenase-like lactoylglutathione lyase family enzyme
VTTGVDDAKPVAFGVRKHHEVGVLLVPVPIDARGTKGDQAFHLGGLIGRITGRPCHRVCGWQSYSLRARRRVCDARRMEQRISLVTLGVTDLSRARSFYEALGWSGAQQPDDEVCFFQAGGMVFGLWTALGGHGAPGIELAHNVRSPEEVGAVLSEAERAGATIVRPAAGAEWGGTSGAFADPDGYVWEVAHNPGWAIGEDGAVRI